MKSSFVIATYNRADDLERCIDSVLKQKNCDFEVIVVDDASTDHTRSMVQEKYGSKVRLIIREENCGSVKNRNLGAQRASGDVLFLIDDDTEFPGNNTASEVMGEFNNLHVGAVAIPYLQDGCLHHAEPDSAGERYVLASYVGCACAVRRSTFLQHGGYEEYFHHQVEEDDFCIRMLNEGMVCMIGRVSEPMVHYESTHRNLFKWDYYGRRNSLLYIWKNCPNVYLFPNLVFTTLRGLQHSFKIRRFRGNIYGLVAGYIAIAKSAVGNGCRRAPVCKRIYDLTLCLRRTPLHMTDVQSAMQ